jgi:hypothetical protein
VEQNVAIEPVTARDLPEVRDDLAELLRDVVNGGGTVGFLPPLSADEAATYWREVGEALEGGRRLLVARQGGRLVGTAQRTQVPRETVWKIRMGPTLRFHELEEGSQKHPYPRFALPKTRDPDPSSYFPNGFSRKVGE